MSYEAYADLAKYIDPDVVGDYDFQIIRDSRPASGYPEYLVLAYDSGPLDADCVVVFDADLKVLGHFTLDELNAMDAANPFDSRGAMVDASGCIVVGNRRFTVSSRTVTYLDTPPIAPHHPGLAVPEAPDPNLVNIRGDVQNLDVRPVQRRLGAHDARGPCRSARRAWHEVIGVWLTDTEVLLVVRHDPDPPTPPTCSRWTTCCSPRTASRSPLRGTYTSACPLVATTSSGEPWGTRTRVSPRSDGRRPPSTTSSSKFGGEICRLG